MKFSKYQALGNDYLILDGVALDVPELARLAPRLCHRNLGVGSDGLLIGPLPSQRADFGLRIINPDGSEAEKSGNGLRIFARYAVEAGYASDQPFQINTRGGVVTVRALDDTLLFDRALESVLGNLRRLNRGK